MVVLLPPHDIFNQSSGALAALSAWRRILAALLRVRGQRPLDALIWTISVERLLGADLTEEIALCKQFQIAQQRLGQTLPVYWLITGLEDIAGTRSLIESLPDEAQKEILGWSSSLPLSAAWQSDYLDAAILQVQSQLGDCICEVATLNGGVHDELYLLPRRLNTLRQPLVTLAEAAFQTNALGDAPVLRGLYLTAAYMPDVGESDAFAEAADLPQPLPVFLPVC